MKRLKKCLCLLLAWLLLGGVTPPTVHASSVIQSGYCGANNTGYEIRDIGGGKRELRVCVNTGFVNNRSVYAYAFDGARGSDFNGENVIYSGGNIDSVYINSYSDSDTYSYGRVKTIEERAFCNAIRSGGSVHLGSDLTTIGRGAFGWMTNSLDTDHPWVHHTVHHQGSSATAWALALGFALVTCLFSLLGAFGYDYDEDIYGWDFDYEGNVSGPLTVTGGENVTTIDNYAFFNRELNVNHFPFENAETIGYYAFKHSFTHLDERGNGTLYIPGATSIDEGAFAENAGLKNVCFNTRLKTENGSWYDEGLTELKRFTFMDCPDLESVVLPDTLTTIRAGAFKNCGSLKTVYVPASVVTIEAGAFPENTTVFCEKGSVAQSYAKGQRLPCAAYNVDDDGKFTIETSGEIGDLGFALETVLCDTSLGNSIYTLDIGEWARAYHSTGLAWGGGPFAGCNNLQTVLLSVGDCDFPEGLFQETCPRTVTINAQDVHISNYMFANCEWFLQNVTCNPGCYVSEVGESAFALCRCLETADLGNQVRAIGSEAFYLCDSMTDVTYGDRAVVGLDAFRDCFALYPEDSEVVAASGRFGSSNSLTWSFTYGGKLTVGGSGAIPDYDLATNLVPWSNYLDRIKTVALGSNITTVGAYAFSSLLNLKTVTGGANVQYIRHHAFYNNPALGIVPTFTKVKEIGAYAFSYCEKLERQPFYQSLISLGDNAFYECGLPLYVMPANTTLTFGDDVFSENAQLVCKAGSAAAEWAMSYDQNHTLWTYDSAANLLTIEANWYRGPWIGTGDFIYGVEAPWQISNTWMTVDLREGVDSIGDNAFFNMYVELLRTAPYLRTVKGKAFARAKVQYWDALESDGYITYVYDGAILDDCLVYCQEDSYLAGWLKENGYNYAMYVDVDNRTMTLSGVAKDWMWNDQAVFEPGYMTIFNDSNVCDTLVIDSNVFQLYGVNQLEDLNTIILPQFVNSYSWSVMDFSETSLDEVVLISPKAYYPGEGFTFGDDELVYCQPGSPAWTTAEDEGFAPRNVLPHIETQPQALYDLRDEINSPDRTTQIRIRAVEGGFRTSLYRQWEVSVDGGETWNEVEGSTSRYRYLDVNVDWDGPNQMYRMRVSSPWVDDVVYSDTCTILTHDEITIDAQPTAYRARLGDTARFTAEASVDNAQGDGDLSYQWQISAPVDNVGWYDLPYAPDATPEEQATLLLEMTEPEEAPGEGALDSVLVRCKITDTYGNVRYSEPASLTMSETSCGGACGANGDNVTWDLNNDGVLTISGTGAMADYSFEYPMPWEAYLEDITTVVVEDGVTAIGVFAFLNCTNLTSVTLPDTLTEIGMWAFFDCQSLPEIHLPADLTQIDFAAFGGCDALNDVWYAGTQAQRANITIDNENEGNGSLLNAVWHYPTETLSASRVTLSWTSKVYNGAVQKPTVTVKNAAGATLTEGTDYTLTWPSGCKTPKTYTVTVTGAGSYTGTVNKTFTITAQPLAASRVTLDWTTAPYSGAVQQPTVTVKNARGTALTLNTSYTVSYSADSKYPGAYTVTVTGKGNYKGTVTKDYQIGKQTLTAANVTLSWTEAPYSAAVQQPAVTVKNAAGKELTLDGSYTVTWPEGCKLPGEYTVTVTGKGYYTGTAEKTFTIAKQTLTAANVTLSAESFTYNGSVQKPTVTVKNAAGSKLTLNSSYTLAWSGECKEEGSYTVTITGKGNYRGTVTRSFTIASAKEALDESRVTLDWTTAPYSGGVQKPAVTVKNAKGTTLTLNRSYTVAYSADSKYPGSYTVTVTGKGNYQGTATKSYTITKQTLTAANVTLSWTERAFNAAVQQPAVTVKNAAGKELTLDGSYTVTWPEGCKLPGEYTVTVTGKGYYTGTAEKTFTIAKQTLDDARVTLSWTEAPYNGGVQKPTVTVKNAAGSKLTLNRSYTVSYSADSKYPGAYTVTVTGAGNYQGTATKSYTITKQTLTAANVTLSPESFTYNGSVQKPAVTVTAAQGTVLTEGGSYTVKWPSGCKAKGTYDVTVTGKGYYTGSFTVSYTIK